MKKTTPRKPPNHWQNIIAQTLKTHNNHIKITKYAQHPTHPCHLKLQTQHHTTKIQITHNTITINNKTHKTPTTENPKYNPNDITTWLKHITNHMKKLDQQYQQYQQQTKNLQKQTNQHKPKWIN